LIFQNIYLNVYSFIIIPGTVREDYSNMKYHLVSGTKGVLMSAVFSGALAAILTFIKG